MKKEEEGMMSFRYALLFEKKLQELQSQLNQMFCNPTEEETAPYSDQTHDVRRKIDFLKTLLSAEMESHPQGNKVEHLAHIEARIGLLEEAFGNWVESQTFPADNLDTLSMCSCTFSCFNEEDEEQEREEEGGGVDLLPDLPPHSVEEQPVISKNPVEEEEETECLKEQRRKGIWFSSAKGRIVYALVPVVVYGLALILTTINNYDRGDEILLVPT